MAQHLKVTAEFALLPVPAGSDQFIPRSGHSTVLCDGKLFILFGSVENSYLDSMYCTKNPLTDGLHLVNPTGGLAWTYAQSLTLQQQLLPQSVSFMPHGFLESEYIYSVGAAKIVECSVMSGITMWVCAFLVVSYARRSLRKETNAWTECKCISDVIPLPAPRSGHRAVVVETAGFPPRVLVLGGLKGTETVSEALLFDPGLFGHCNFHVMTNLRPHSSLSATSCWSAPVLNGTPPSGRQMHSLDLWRGTKAVVFGGIDATGEVLSDLHILDLGLHGHRIRGGNVERRNLPALWGCVPHAVQRQ